LKQFPLDALKIDRAFISNIGDDQINQDDATLALTIINLAHNLKLKVVAEGVETEAQARFLIRHGCDVLQGFYFSRPVAPHEFAQMLNEPARFALPETMSVVPCVLLMDDHHHLCLLERALRGEGYRILKAETPGHAFEQLANHRVDMVIADQSTSQLSGIEFLTQVKTLYPDTIRVVHAGLNDAEMIMDAVNNASVHKLMSNEWDVDSLRNTVREALHTAAA
jgi:CheY-like chemotaxis protein